MEFFYTMGTLGLSVLAVLVTMTGVSVVKAAATRRTGASWECEECGEMFCSMDPEGHDLDVVTWTRYRTHRRGHRER